MRPRRRMTGVLATVTMLATTGTSVARAEPDPAAPAPKVEAKVDVDARTLAGHTFLRSVLEDSAFLATSVGFRQGIFYVDAGTVKAFNGTKAVTMAAALESLDANVRVVDWLAVSATADLQAVVGASEVSLYSNASSFAGSLRFGPAVRALHLPKTGTQITVRPYYQATFGAVLDVSQVLPSLRARILQEVAAPPTSQNEALSRASAFEAQLVEASVTPLRRGAFGGSVHVAQAITPLFGAQLAYDLRRERYLATPYDLVARSRSEVAFYSLLHRVTLTLSFDAARLGVPLGATLEAAVAAGSIHAEASAESSTYDPTVLLGPGLYYTGRKYLQLGVFAGWQKGMARYVTLYGESDRPTAYYGQFTLRHYF